MIRTYVQLAFRCTFRSSEHGSGEFLVWKRVGGRPWLHVTCCVVRVKVECTVDSKPSRRLHAEASAEHLAHGVAALEPRCKQLLLPALLMSTDFSQRTLER